MATRGLSGLAFILIFAAVGSLSIANVSASPSVSLIQGQERGAAEALLDKYIQAFQSRDLALASKIYAHDGDLVVYGSSPADRRHGWNQTEDYLRKYFAAVDSITIVLKERNIKVNTSGKVAWFAQVLKWTETEGGKSYTMEGLRITGVLEKRDYGWVIVQLHASGPPPVS